MKSVNFWLIVSLFFISQRLYSQTLICQQDHRDVRVELYITQEKVKLMVMSPMGYSFLQFLDTPVSASSINQLTYQAEQLKPLGDAFWVEWKRDSCQFKIETPLKNPMLECGKADKSSVDKFEFLSFTIATLTEESFAGIWKSLRFRMSVAVDGKWGSDTFFISLPIHEQACLSVDKQKKKTSR